MATDNCPVLVKTAVGKMEGIKSVEASNETKSARGAGATSSRTASSGCVTRCHAIAA